MQSLGSRLQQEITRILREEVGIGNLGSLHIVVEKIIDLKGKKGDFRPDPVLSGISAKYETTAPFNPLAYGISDSEDDEIAKEIDELCLKESKLVCDEIEEDSGEEEMGSEMDSEIEENSGEAEDSEMEEAIFQEEEREETNEDDDDEDDDDEGSDSDDDDDYGNSPYATNLSSSSERDSEENPDDAAAFRDENVADDAPSFAADNRPFWGSSWEENRPPCAENKCSFESGASSFTRDIPSFSNCGNGDQFDGGPTEENCPVKFKKDF
jgi:hypothetical protein